MNILRSVNQSFVQCLQVFYLHTLHIGIDQNRSRVVSYHTAAVTRTCPFGEETTFLIGIDQTFLHFLVDRREHQVQEREQTAECIPEACISVHISRQYLTVVRTVMNHFSVCIQFIELTREQQRTIQTRIERTILVKVSAFYFNLAQDIVPGFFPFLYQCIETVIAQLLHVDGSLFIADERRSYFGMNNLTFLRLETDHSTCMIGLLFYVSFA